MARKASGKAKNSRSRTGSTGKTRAASGARKARPNAGRTAKASARPATKPTRRKAGAGAGARKTTAARTKETRKNTSPRGERPRAGRPDTGRSRPEIENTIDVTAEVQERYDTEDDDVPTPPSTLNLDRSASAARTGHQQLVRRRRQHTAASPAISGGDVDADWEQAYFVGDESATADNPTPDQSDVEDIGRAVGLDYEDTEELKSTPKVEKRDRKRWELDPASSEDYKDRSRKK